MRNPDDRYTLIDTIYPHATHAGNVLPFTLPVGLTPSAAAASSAVPASGRPCGSEYGSDHALQPVAPGVPSADLHSLETLQTEPQTNGATGSNFSAARMLSGVAPTRYVGVALPGRPAIHWRGRALRLFVSWLWSWIAPALCVAALAGLFMLLFATAIDR